MPKGFAKLDANTLEITKTVVPQTIVETYTYDDLAALVTNLQAQKDAFNADIDSQIADAQANVDAANDLGIVALPISASPTLRDTIANPIVIQTD